MSIDPRLASNPAGAEQELLAFIDTAHALGIYVIFDIVLNHTGDVFEYPGFGSQAPFSQSRRDVRWRDSNGNPTTVSDGAAMPDATAMPLSHRAAQKSFLPATRQRGSGRDRRGFRVAEANAHRRCRARADSDQLLSVL